MVTPLEALKASSLLVGLSSEEIEALLAISEQRTCSAPALIVAEGTPSDCLFILLDGSVVIEKENAGSPVVLATFTQNGDFFGEMSLIDIMPRSANIRAREDVQILAFPKKELASFFTKLPRAQMTMILNIARNLSLRLRASGERIVELTRSQ
jgi:CRP/FNR family cyclic AMP-dependent transcriptional regulator